MITPVRTPDLSARCSRHGSFLAQNVFAEKYDVLALESQVGRQRVPLGHVQEGSCVPYGWGQLLLTLVVQRTSSFV